MSAAAVIQPRRDIDGIIFGVAFIEDRQQHFRTRANMSVSNAAIVRQSSFVTYSDSILEP